MLKIDRSYEEVKRLAEESGR